MSTPLPWRDRAALRVQRAVGHLTALVWIPVCASLIRWVFRWRIEGVEETRRAFRELRAEPGPLLVCPNHLTMLDSFLVAYALGSPAWHMLHFSSSMPWNVPERRNFASTWWKRILVYAMQCVPIERGGDRGEVGRVFARLGSVLANGHPVLVFPEGQRSRAGRVDRKATTYGVGRLVKSQPGCRVLCVYLRGEKQDSWSDRPASGQSFRVALECFEPKSDHRGLRGSVDLTRQILSCLAALEDRHFAAEEGES
ncbi:MAG: lysophospholipid acyltransferase family protein [Myxococcota bacterium]|nr:lysophospholipid acyltransferase family protein [Myxococcota bacterium]